MASFGTVAPVAETDDKSTQGAFAILSVLGDDNKFKQRLKELNDIAAQANADLKAAFEAQAKAEETEAKAQKAAIKAAKLHADATELKQAAQDQANASAAAIYKREENLKLDKEEFITWMTKEKTAFYKEADAQSAALAAQGKQLRDAAIAQDVVFAEKAKQYDDKVAALVVRETALTVAEQKVKDTADALKKQQADLDRRLVKLRDIVG